METIYWILTISVMLILLIFNIYLFIDTVKSNKRIKSYYKKQEEYFIKAIKEIDRNKEEN